MYNKTYYKKWKSKNVEHLKKYQEEYYTKNSDKKRQYRFAHRKEMAKYAKEYRRQNKLKIKKYKKKYQKNNIEKIREYCRNYLNKHPLKRKLYNCNTMARRRGQNFVNKSTIELVYKKNIKKYGLLTCVLCNVPILLGEDSLEHLTPVSRGGTNVLSNLAVSHLWCNRQKYNKTYKEYKKSPL